MSSSGNRNHRTFENRRGADEDSEGLRLTMEHGIYECQPIFGQGHLQFGDKGIAGIPDDTPERFRQIHRREHFKPFTFKDLLHHVQKREIAVDCQNPRTIQKSAPSSEICTNRQSPRTHISAVPERTSQFCHAASRKLNILEENTK